MSRLYSTVAWPELSECDVGLTTEEEKLLRVAKAHRHVLRGYKEGVHLQAITGRTIDDLTHQVCADRIALAQQFISAGDKLMRSRPPMFRMAVGRYYYAMYHTMRGVVYFNLGGDDFEAHSDLPGKTPRDFVQAPFWENELKDARYRRNEADYDPYPRANAEFQLAARQLRSRAHDLHRAATQYLRGKGCGYV